MVDSCACGADSFVARVQVVGVGHVGDSADASLIEHALVLIAQPSSFDFCCAYSASVMAPCACSAASLDSSSAVLPEPAV